MQETHYDPWGVELSGLGYQYGGIKVNPYLYNGKEANGHLGVNLFDYGARMYDPAIGRWFVPDPLAEQAPGWTPYRYGFNNPLKFTDPTGMFEYVKGGYGEDIEVGNVWSHTEDGADLSDFTNTGEESEGSENNGSRKNNPPKNNSRNNGTGPDGQPSEGRGSATSFSFGFAFGFGISGEWGVVEDETGNSKGYYTVSANFGLGLDIGFTEKEIIPINGKSFRIEDYGGIGKNVSVGVGFTSESRGGNTTGKPTLSPFDFGTTYKERSNSYSPFFSIPAGISDVGLIYQIGKTKLFK